MGSPYLLEIRTGGNTKYRLRNIIYDVEERFDVHAAAEPRAVPHITLFGPYNTDRGREVKNTLLDVFENYDVVPYRIDGFSHFRKDVVYADVVPSKELRQLRREVSRRLRPITYNYSPHDSDFYHEFHITIAFRDLDGKFDDIMDYVTSRYNPQRDEYATRMTNLSQGEMMWEYDLPQGEVLSSQEATSASSWEKTNEALRQKASSADHKDKNLVPTPESALVKYKNLAKSKLPI